MPDEETSQGPLVDAADLRACALLRWVSAPLGKLVRNLVGGIAIASLFLPIRFGPVAFFWALPFFVPAIAQQVVLRRAARRLLRLIEAGRQAANDEAFADFRMLSEAILGPPNARNTDLYRLVEADEHALRGEWAEVRKIYEAYVDREQPPIARTSILTALAFSTAMSGDHARGLAFAEAAVASVDEMNRRTKAQRRAQKAARRSAQSTLATCLCLSGQHERAIKMLEPLLEGKDRSRTLASRRFFIAKAWLGLGQTDRSTAMLQEVAAEKNLWGQLAREELARLTASPHREKA